MAGLTMSQSAASGKTDEVRDGEGLYLGERHPISRRTAVLDDDGRCAWLTLSAPDSYRPVADVWVYNRIEAPAPDQIPTFRPSPPPAAAGYATATALIREPGRSRWSLVWSADGEAVAVTRDGEPVAFVRSDRKMGWGRELLKDGPWGSVWSDRSYGDTFGPQGA